MNSISENGHSPLSAVCAMGRSLASRMIRTEKNSHMVDFSTRLARLPPPSFDALCHLAIRRKSACRISHSGELPQSCPPHPTGFEFESCQTEHSQRIHGDYSLPVPCSEVAATYMPDQSEHVQDRDTRLWPPTIGASTCSRCAKEPPYLDLNN